MPDRIVIEVDQLAKQYRLGEISTGTLTHDLNRWFHRVRGKPDPYLPVTQENRREDSGDTSGYVWALQPMSFRVKQGEVLGIIGRNGAGKSTLLKILSRVTSPSSGRIRIRGSISALLEVGTGFHPELTGRENIFLNGAILGLTRDEIRARLDSIVEFSGCARYVDTPVKRYSSGMVVRLGFAVAAHLDPDILIVDEVLAVGDAEFQRKCIGKIRDVAGHGRTVLFVSHNMDAIRSLTSRCIVLESGRIAYDAPTDEAVARYAAAADSVAWVGPVAPVDVIPMERRARTDPVLSFAALGLATGARAEIPSGGTLELATEVESQIPLQRLSIGYSIRHETTAIVASGYTSLFDLPAAGRHRVVVRLDQLDLAPGTYDLHLSLNRGGLTEVRHTTDILFGVARFRVTSDRSEGGILPVWKSGWGHVIHRHGHAVRQPDGVAS